jgi:hypothetical protein
VTKRIDPVGSLAFDSRHAEALIGELMKLAFAHVIALAELVSRAGAAHSWPK